MRLSAIAATAACLVVLSSFAILQIDAVLDGARLAAPIRLWMSIGAILTAIASATLWVLLYLVRLLRVMKDLTIAGVAADELLAIRRRIQRNQ